MTMQKLPDLPYAETALEPHISAETLQYHHGKHHAKYVSKLNDLITGTEFEDKSLEEIIRNAPENIFNNAAQAWNHTFYWNCLSPKGGGKPEGRLADAIEEQFGSFDAFKERFTQTGLTVFGSGWVWLNKDATGKLVIRSAGNAGTPIRDGLTPVLTCDVWEHAYYIDYRNARPKYLEAFWALVNWEFAGKQYMA